MALPTDSSFTVLAAGVQQASGAASASANLPNNLSGTVPTKVRVSATVAACIRIGITGVVATAADTMIQPGDAAMMRVPLGCTKFAVIQVAAGGFVQVSPCEDA